MTIDWTKETHLHLGCGRIALPGWVNIDRRYHPGVDYVDNIGILREFRAESITAIYCCHALDHFSRWDYPRVLKRWCELLSPGGTLRISTPDFAKIWFRYEQTRDVRALTGSLYAAQDYESNFRKVMFDYRMLAEDLIEAGFSSVTTFEPFVDGDCSHVWSSLNVEGTK